MRPGKVIFLVVITVAGGTVLAKHFRPLAKVPGFSPAG